MIPSTLISELWVDDAKELMASGSIGGGMLPKLQNCIDAIAHGVSPGCIFWTAGFRTVSFWRSLQIKESAQQY